MLASMQLSWDYLKHRPLQRARQSRVGQDEEDIRGKIAIVTGSNSGLGKQAALELCKRGAIVVMACRDMRKAEEARDEILKEVEAANLDPIHLDLGDLDSVRKFVCVVKEKYPRVDILINNAGISELEIKKTKHGFESNMGVNYFGPFLLTLLLIDHLEKAEHGRIVCVSSCVLQMAKLDAGNILPENQLRGFLGLLPYANSKLANALFVKELAKVLMKTNITCYAVCPGLVDTNAFRYTPWYLNPLKNLTLFTVGFNVREGCATIIYCAVSKAAANESGSMYRFIGRWDTIQTKLDDQSASKLWERSEEIVGMTGFSQKYKSARTVASQ